MSAPSSPHSTRNPTIKRIQREALELVRAPSPDFTAFPLETNLFEWHFTVRGPPAPSPYASGIYHGRIVLPATYPLRPPSFRFLTPSGRFEVNREICLSISGHHEESWQPAWGIRTALVAIRSFMDTDAKGQVGGVDANRDVRESFARQSRGWKCAGCGEGKNNEEVMKGVEEECQLLTDNGDGTKRQEEKVPEELKLGYRDELGKNKEAGQSEAKDKDNSQGGDMESWREASQMSSSQTDAAQTTSPAEQSISTAMAQTPPTAVESSQPRPTPTVPLRSALQQQALRQPNSEENNWLDMAIAGVAAALFVMVVRKIVQYL